MSVSSQHALCCFEYPATGRQNLGFVPAHCDTPEPTRNLGVARLSGGVGLFPDHAILPLFCPTSQIEFGKAVTHCFRLRRLLCMGLFSIF
jgi:hypothetical protein